MSPPFRSLCLSLLFCGLSSLTAGAIGPREPVTLDFNGSGISDARLAKALAQHPDVENLQLSGTNVTDEGMKQLRSLRHLRDLNLGLTGVGDLGLSNLQGAPALRSLTL